MTIKQEKPLNSYKFQLTLTIKRLQPEDFGTYRCISKNSIGQAEEEVELYGESFCLSACLSVTLFVCLSVFLSLLLLCL